MRPQRVFLSLGSNVGDRAGHLRRALEALARLPRTRLVRRSQLYETAPFGVRGQRAYFNAAAAVETSLSPMGLLLQLKLIECGEGRRRALRWAPRVLDIDILYHGRLRFKNPFLAIPHPGTLKRRFVLVPLAEIAPGFRPPDGLGPTAAALLERLKAPSQTVKMAVR